MAKVDFASKLLAVVFAAMLFASCGSEPSSNQGDPVGEPETEPEVEVEVETMEDEDESFMLPSPLQIAAIFKKSGLKYAEGVTNPAENITSYNSSMSKSLNFGVYSADLSYCVLNNQTNEARKYMQNVRQLSDELGMSAIFSTRSLFESFERNLGNEDSTLYILATIQEELDDYLSDNDQEYMTSVYFAGGWIEGIHIGSSVKSEDAGNDKLARRLLEQLTILENLIRALKAFPNENEELTTLIGKFENLNEQFNNVEAIRTMREKGEDFEFEEVTFTDEELDGLTSTIQSIRNDITNGQ